MPDVYRPSPRHKQPWQPGARGTLCPPEVDGPVLFATSVADPARPGKRYNTDGVHAYCAHPSTKQTAAGDTVEWHGFPVEWRTVPIAIQRTWVSAGLIGRLRLRG